MKGIEFGTIATKKNGERGWIMGNFPQLSGTPFHTEAFEVKWSKLRRGDRKEKTAANKTAKSLTILVSGKLRTLLDSQETHTLEKEGDYLFWDGG